MRQAHLLKPDAGAYPMGVKQRLCRHISRSAKETHMAFILIRGSRRSRRCGVSLLLLGLSLAACQARPLWAQEAEKTAIREAARNFDRAEGLGDPDSILAFMWEDAVLQPANGRRIEGHEAIRAFYARRAGRIGAGATQSQPVTPAPVAPARDTTRPRLPSGLVVSAAGDMAVQWAPGESTTQRADGPRTYYYSFMTIWERRGGEWKILVNTWNIRPAPETTPSADTTGQPN